MPNARPSSRRHHSAVLFEAPGGDALAARARARALLAPAPPDDLGGIATLMVTAALLHAAQRSGDRVTEAHFHRALRALLRGPGKDWHESPMIFVSYAAAERRDLPHAQLQRLATWFKDHLGVTAQARAHDRRAAQPQKRSGTQMGPVSS